MIGKSEIKTPAMQVDVKSDVATEIEKVAFSSGATSSQQVPPYHLAIAGKGFEKKALRFGVGNQKHGDVNYQKSISIIKDISKELEANLGVGLLVYGDKILDLEFARDRWNHGLHHYMNLKKTGNSKDDNIGAVEWALEYLSWVEEHGFDWQEILTPRITNEVKMILHTNGSKTVINQKGEKFTWK